jgi:GNAT superfamily N-acetyltransferase
MPITFHPAGMADLPELIRMMKELQRDDPWSIPFEESAATHAAAQLLQDPSLGRVWFIASESKTVGYIVMAFDYSLEYRGRNAWIDELFVRSAHRGLGIGAQALDFFMQQAKGLGAAVVHLEVNHGNRAIELYRRLGFEDHHRYLMSKWIIEKPRIG